MIMRPQQADEQGKGREDMKGLKEIDWNATQALLHGKVPKEWRLGPMQRTMLSTVLTGSSRPIRRLWKAGRWHQPWCPFCNKKCPETKHHIFWECPAVKAKSNARSAQVRRGHLEAGRHRSWMLRGLEA